MLPSQSHPTCHEAPSSQTCRGPQKIGRLRVPPSFRCPHPHLPWQQCAGPRSSSRLRTRIRMFHSSLPQQSKQAGRASAPNALRLKRQMKTDKTVEAEAKAPKNSRVSSQAKNQVPQCLSTTPSPLRLHMPKEPMASQLTRLGLFNSLKRSTAARQLCYIARNRRNMWRAMMTMTKTVWSPMKLYRFQRSRSAGLPVRPSK